MKIVFISNYINHHQKPFCDAMYKRLKDDFMFIQTEPMEEERINMGWDTSLVKLPYVKLLYEDSDFCENAIDNCDVLLAGWTQRTDLIIKRLKKDRITIRVSERIYREGRYKFISPRGLLSKYKEHIQFRKSKAYLLCCGAYVPADFSLIHAYPDKMYKFGYFPQTKEYELENLFKIKDSEGKIQILYAGRFMKLKHPEYVIQLAYDIKVENIRREKNNLKLLPEFAVHMVGSGELEEELKQTVIDKGLDDVVKFYGFLKPDEVRSIMEKCHIHIFPSNHLEGWGAVVNEAMNSACAVVASSQAGAVPYLIKQYYNGIAYKKNDYAALKDAVIYLMTHNDERKKIAENAYNTITKLWNADNASDKLLSFIDGLMHSDNRVANEGPLSKAPVISPGKMYDYMNKNRAGKGF